MRAGETNDIEVWVALDTGDDLDNYNEKAVAVYYNNGISNKIVAIYRDFLGTTTTPEGPPLGATWEYLDLTVDNTPFVDGDLQFAGKLLFTMGPELTEDFNNCKVRKPQFYIEVILKSSDTIIKEVYALEEFEDSVTAGLL
jgi:hypothetical protein